MKTELTIGVDIGGSGIKASTVDIAAGTMTRKRTRIKTPQPATPDAVCAVVKQLVETVVSKAGEEGIPLAPRIGIGFPGVVTNGHTRTAANVDSGWVDLDATALLGAAVNRPVTIVNDADAAGLAEARFGAGHNHPGLVLVLTLGTGIGSALFIGGRLVPNTELGHLRMYGKSAEARTAASAREAEDLSWKEWGGRLTEYLAEIERTLWPDLIILGGGVSKHFSKFEPYLKARCPTVPAELGNPAGIIGSALAASAS